jgi:tRNA threonylcarbamoyladenosine biosynthesis protein TsaE
MTIQFTITEINELKKTASDLLEAFSTSRIFLFQAEMGAGKTTFIKELAKHLGIASSLSSPTYSIVNEYKCGIESIYHFDLYRLKNINECLDFGMEEYLNSGNYCFIEWPEIASPLYPEKSVFVKIDVRDGKRIIEASINE